MFTKKTAFSVIIVLSFLLTGCDKRDERLAHFVEPKCISSQSKCEVVKTNETFKVMFNAEPVITETEFTIFLNTNTADRVVKIDAYMEGKEMFMGKIPLFFQAVENSNNFAADTLLGSCSDEKMVWIIWFDVTIERTNKVIEHEKFSIEYTSQRY